MGPPVIQNIVATGALPSTLGLQLGFVAENILNVEYNPKKFAAAIIRVRKPFTTILLFESGRIVCTGAKNVEDCQRSVHIMKQTLSEIGYPGLCECTQLTIQNMVASFDAGFSIDLLRLCEGEHDAIFEPELFPGLNMRLHGACVLVFVSGKCVITGCKREDHVIATHTELRKILPRYKWNAREPKEQNGQS